MQSNPITSWKSQSIQPPWLKDPAKSSAPYFTSNRSHMHLRVPCPYFQTTSRYKKVLGAQRYRRCMLQRPIRSLPRPLSSQFALFRSTPSSFQFVTAMLCIGMSPLFVDDVYYVHISVCHDRDMRTMICTFFGSNVCTE